jgi:hypothetical protein
MTTRKAPPAAWKPGQSGNPAGKPKGARNHATRAALALMEGAGEQVIQVVIDAAKAGDLGAARIVLDKLMPNAKERAVELPELPDTKDAQGVADAQAAILHAVAAGELTPGEASTLSGIVEARRKAVETAELEQRIAQLENRK